MQTKHNKQQEGGTYGEGHFWKDQDLWSNKKDCCNVKGRVDAFKNDARQILFEDRLKFTNHKSSTPKSERLHEGLGSKISTKIESELNL
jgi:hypothetical protein